MNPTTEVYKTVLTNMLVYYFLKVLMKSARKMAASETTYEHTLQVCISREAAFLRKG